MHPDMQSSPLPSGDVAPHHAELLTSSGITIEHAVEHGVRSVLTDADLPEELQGLHFARTPGLLFQWKSPTRGIVHQFRPDTPVENDQGDPVKYVFPTGSSSVLNALRPQGSTVLIVEGTKQSLAAAEYAPIDTAVYGMAGCWGWRKDGVSIPDLSIVFGREVIVVLDADAGRNLDVYNAGVALREALQAEGALTVRFMRLPASGKAGLDDVLGARPDRDSRVNYMRTLIEKVKAPTTKTDIEKTGVERPADKAPGKKADDKPAFVPDPQKLMVEATDLDVADAYVALHGDALRFESTTERWLTYNIGKWDAEGGFTLARTLFRDMVKNEIVAVSYSSNGEVQDERAWLTCQPRIGHVLGFASANRVIHVRARDLDPDPYLWNARNCVIGLGKGNVGEVYAHSPDYLMTQQSDVVYDPDAECPEFLAFLRYVLPDEEVRAYVQRVLGLALVGYPVEHIFPVFIGTGRNGKGTLIRLVSKVFGDYATGIKRDVLVETKFEGHQTKLATLFKKRLATTEEMAATSAWDVAVVKTLTGGDAITANYMRQDDFTFDPSHMLLLSTNHRPHVAEGEHAFWARYREIPFTQVIERPDSSVEQRMMGELSGILNWLLDGLIDYYDQGDAVGKDGDLATPKAVAEATAGAKNEADPLFRFITEEVVRTGDLEDWLLGSEVADRYRKWCEQQDDVRPMAPRGFHKAFCTLLGLDASGDGSTDAGRERVGDKSKVRVYRRLRWTTDADDLGAAANEVVRQVVRQEGETTPTHVSAGQDITAAPAADAAAKNDGNPRSKVFKEDTPVEEKTPKGPIEEVDLPQAPHAPRVQTGLPESPQVSTSRVTAAAWVDLMVADAPVLPQTTCRDCGATEVVDDEVGIFKLCPECTSGSLRKPTA